MTTQRVYSYQPRSGERPLAGLKVYNQFGERLFNVARVVFDRDEDQGLATVTSGVSSETGRPFIDYEQRRPCLVTFRTWVMVCAEPPERRDDPLLWDLGYGRVVLDGDPLPEAGRCDAGTSNATE